MSNTSHLHVSLNKLALFVAVADHGSIRGGAEKMRVSQPAVSRAIRDLESQLGAPLFDRAQHGVVLTAYGKSFLSYCRSAMSSIGRGLVDLDALKQGSSGIVNVGTSPAFFPLLARAMTALNARAPSYTYMVREGFYPKLLPMLFAGELDVLVAMLSPDLFDIRNVKCTPLISITSSLIARREHPLAARQSVGPEDLLEAQWIFPETSPRKYLSVIFGPRIPTLNELMRTDSTAMMRSVLLSSDSIVFANDMLFADDLKAGTLARLPVTFGIPPTQIGLIEVADRVSSHAMEALCREVQAVCEAL